MSQNFNHLREHYPFFPPDTNPFAMNLKPIGIIHSPFKTRAEAPFQGRHSEEVCEVEVFEEFLPGLSDVEGCTHLFLPPLARPGR
jgi:tRNA (Thr-GGU) A37 N-methylase